MQEKDVGAFGKMSLADQVYQTGHGFARVDGVEQNGLGGGQQLDRLAVKGVKSSFDEPGQNLQLSQLQPFLHHTEKPIFPHLATNNHRISGGSQAPFWLSV